MADEQEETKRAKFVRLMNARGGKALKYLKAVGTLANKAAYEFTEKDIAAYEKAASEAAKKSASQLRAALKGEPVQTDRS